MTCVNNQLTDLMGVLFERDSAFGNHHTYSLYLTFVIAVNTHFNAVIAIIDAEWKPQQETSIQ